MDIQIANGIGRRLPREHVVTRMEHALQRALGDAASARVAFTDVNGPKGGIDVRCTVLVHMPGHAPVTATRAGTTARLAFAASYDAVIQQLDHVRARWEDAVRRPKKYYAARRLL